MNFVVETLNYYRNSKIYLGLSSLHSSACKIGLHVVKPQPRQGSLRTNLVEPSDMKVPNPSPSPSDLGVGLP